MLNQRFFELKLTKYTVFLSESEVISLLERDRLLWELAIRRGKAFLRARAARGRESKVPARATEKAIITGFETR